MFGLARPGDARGLVDGDELRVAGGWLAGGQAGLGGCHGSRTRLGGGSGRRLRRRRRGRSSRGGFRAQHLAQLREVITLAFAGGIRAVGGAGWSLETLGADLVLVAEVRHLGYPRRLLAVPVGLTE